MDDRTVVEPEQNPSEAMDAKYDIIGLAEENSTYQDGVK